MIISYLCVPFLPVLFSLFVQPEPNTLSLGAVLEKFVRFLSLKKLTSFMPPFIPKLNGLFINRLLVDMQKREYHIQLSLPGVITIFKGHLTVSNVKAEFKVKNKAVSLGFSADGTWLGHKVRAEFYKEGNVYRLLASASEFHLGKLLGKLTSKFDALGLHEFRIKKPSIEVVWGKESPVFTVRGVPVLREFELAKVQATIFNFTKPHDMTFFVGFNVNGHMISKLVKSLADVDISGVPTLGRTSPASLVITVATKELEFSEGFEFDMLNITEKETVDQGIRVLFFQTVAKKNVLFQMAMGKKAISIKLPNGVSLDDIISYLSPSLAHSSEYKSLLKVIGWGVKLQVKAFIHDIQNKRTSIVGRFPKSFSLFKGRFKLREGKYNVTLFRERKFALQLTGKMELFKKHFEATVGYDTKLKEFTLELETHASIQLSDFTSAFKATSKNRFLSKLHLNELGVAKPMVEVMKGHHGFGFR